MRRREIVLAGTLAILPSMATAQSNTFPASGNVGVGTTSPGYPLTVTGSAAIGDTVGSASDPSNIPLVNKYVGTTTDAATDYVLLSYTNTSTGTFSTSGFDGQIFLYRGSEGSWNGASVYDVAIKDAYNSYAVMRFNTFGSLNGANVVTLNYDGNSYVAVQIPLASSMDVYVTGRSWGFVPIVTTASQVSGVSQLSAPYLTATTGGNIGIGISAPAKNLDVNKGPVAGGGMQIDGTNDTRLTLGVGEPTAWSWSNGWITPGDFSLIQEGVSGDVLYVKPGGNIGIGTTSPAAKLEVDGNLRLTAGSGASITFQDGTTQSTAYTGVTCGGDYAESVDVSSARKNFGPGDLLIIDPKNPSKFLKSSEPYSTAVAGIYSTKPGTVGRRQITPKSPDEIPMAVVGIVPAKVTAENGPIRPSDLLVSSSTPGYAMKGTDRSRMLGAVVGKAMGSLDSGIGVVEVLVTLQ